MQPGGEVAHVGHADAQRQVAEQELVVGGVAHVEPAAALGVEVAPIELAHHPARPAELGVLAEPAVDVDRADGRTHALLAHEGHHALDARLVQPRVLRVVDGDVGHAPGAVARQGGARHVGEHAGGHLAQPAGVARARGLVLGPGHAQRARTAGLIRGLQGLRQEGHRPVLRHERSQRPLPREGLAPAHRAPGDGHHGHRGGRQRVQRLARRREQLAVVGERVVDVGEHASHPDQCGRGQLAQRARAVHGLEVLHRAVLHGFGGLGTIPHCSEERCNLSP